MKILRCLTAGLAGHLCLLWTQGCNNRAVYFYETDKVALEIESRPDPTQPISGTLALKTRVAAIVPPTHNQIGHAATPASDLAGVTAKFEDVSRAATQPGSPGLDAKEADAVDAYDSAHAADAGGDAVSVLSSFRFQKFPRASGSNSVFGRVSVDSALITGKAAVAVALNGTQKKAVRIMTGQPAESSTEILKIAALKLLADDLANTAKPDAKAAEISKTLNSLAATIASKVEVDIYDEDRLPALALEVVDLAGDPILPPGPPTFSNISTYDGKLHHSEAVLTDMLASMERNTATSLPFTVKPKGTQPFPTGTVQIYQKLQTDLAKTKQLHAALLSAVSASPAVQDLIRFNLGSKE